MALQDQALTRREPMGLSNPFGLLRELFDEAQRVLPENSFSLYTIPSTSRTIHKPIPLPTKFNPLSLSIRENFI